MARSAPGVGSACPRLGRAEPCSAAFPTPVHDPHRYGAEHGSALPHCGQSAHLRFATLLASVPRIPASVEPSHARLLSRHLCMIPTAAVPSKARHYPIARNEPTWAAEHGSALPGTVVSHSAPDLACYRVDAWASPAIDQDATLPRHAIRPGPASSSREGLCMHACRKTAPLRAPFVYQPCSNDLPHSRCRGVRPARPGPGAAARSVAPAARAGTRPPPRSVRRPVPPAGARPRWLPPPVPHSAGSRHPSVPRSG